MHAYSWEARLANVYLIGLYKEADSGVHLVLGDEPPVQFPAFPDAPDPP